MASSSSSSSPSSAIVVGGGLSGLSAAHTLLEAGVHVVLLERNPFLGGNSTKATSGINGTFTRTQNAMDIEDSQDKFLEDMVRSATGMKTGPMPEPYPLAQVLTGESGEGVEWIQDKFGLALDVVSRMGGHSYERTHRSRAGGKFPGMEITSALIKKYEELADLEDGTCDLVINASARGLIKDPAGRVCGVAYEDGDGQIREVLADAVVLATGGYGAGGQAAGSILEKVRPDLMHLPTTNGDHSLGDGIKIALDIGAKAVALKHVQVHPTGLVNPDDPDNRTKFLAAEALRGEGAIIIDNEGNRFCNDIGKRDYVTGRMWEHNKAPYRLVLNTKASSQMPWHCKHYVSRRVMKHFKSGSDLAAEMGIPVQALDKTFTDYNFYSQNPGTDPHGKIYFKSTPFEVDDSFFVAQVTPVVHYTMGGLAITPRSECVYDETSRVIPGLFAAGELAGGVHGRNRLGGSALLECVVFGRVAGRNAAAFVGNKPQPAPGSGAGATTTQTISIPQANGLDPITITTTSSAEGTGTGEVVGEKVEINEWEEAVTTEIGGLTAAADGTEAATSAAPVAAAAAPVAAVPAGPASDVAIVYGSFFMGDSERDAKAILAANPGDCGLDVAEAAVAGNDFDFNSLKDTKFLVVCTSSMYGNPPKNFWEFYYHLKVASENNKKPLAGLQHCVYGNGDETYLDTYMNVPRMVDQLLEKAGSRRFFARGETSEPHAPLGLDMCDASSWAPGMWSALKEARATDPAVSWDKHWEGSEPNHHDKVTDWTVKKLEKKFGVPESGQSIFSATPSKL